jgi:hypothetical protein
MKLIKKYIYWVLGILVLFSIPWSILPAHNQRKQILIDESGKGETVIQTIPIDKVWSGHSVGFCLLTNGNIQYIAYYNAKRHMVVGQRNLDEPGFSLTELEPTTRETSGGTSTVLGWDSHNYVTYSSFRKYAC